MLSLKLSSVADDLCKHDPNSSNKMFLDHSSKAAYTFDILCM